MLGSSSSSRWRLMSRVRPGRADVGSVRQHRPPGGSPPRVWLDSSGGWRCNVGTFPGALHPVEPKPSTRRAATVWRADQRRIAAAAGPAQGCGVIHVRPPAGPTRVVVEQAPDRSRSRRHAVCFGADVSGKTAARVAKKKKKQRRRCI